jgi:glucokinase
MSTGLRDGKLRLIADIGGTNARFAIVQGDSIHHEETFACADYPTLTDAVHTYFRAIGDASSKLHEAALAIAGPIQGDVVAMTNHPWRFSVAETRKQLELDRLIVLNDFTALAMAIRHLPQQELERIGGSHAAPEAAISLLGPGTGLGVSGLIPFQGTWIPLQGEGGHVTLPVTTERENDIVAYLRKQFTHVSAERVLSGPGLVNLYHAICAIEDKRPVALTPPDITSFGLDGTDPICREVLQMFCAFLGTVAGNLALTLGALGGLYIGGGIVPRFGKFFAASQFRERFEDKGRYANYLAPVPAYVINSDKPAFVGLMRAFESAGPRVEARGG